MKAIKIRTAEQLQHIWQGGDGMSEVRAETSLGDAPLRGQKFAARKTMSLCEEDYEPSSSRPASHAQGGQELHANGLSGM